MPFGRRFAVWEFTVADNAAVAVHVLVPLNSSAVPRDPVEFDPPARRTEPLFAMLVERSVTVWSSRPAVNVPAADHVPDAPVAGSKRSAVSRTVDTLRPPVMSTLPLPSTVAV